MSSANAIDDRVNDCDDSSDVLLASLIEERFIGFDWMFENPNTSRDTGYNGERREAGKLNFPWQIRLDEHNDCGDSGPDSNSQENHAWQQNLRHDKHDSKYGPMPIC